MSTTAQGSGEVLPLFACELDHNKVQRMLADVTVHVMRVAWALQNAPDADLTGDFVTCLNGVGDDLYRARAALAKIDSRRLRQLLRGPGETSTCVERGSGVEPVLTSAP